MAGAINQRSSPARCAAQRLVTAVQALSQARTPSEVADIVRVAARELTGADGATFVLRDGDSCCYVEENAIAPLWKGRRFPMSACVSGWVMQHSEPVVIPDIYADPRIPTDVYLPTFVKSLAMVPIRRAAPLGAIGNYWARERRITARELELLQALADSTAVAMENVVVYQELEQRVRARTEELEVKNRELAQERERLIEVQRQRDALNALVVHDLKSPANAIMLAASLRLGSEGLSEQTRRDWSRVLENRSRIFSAGTTLGTSADGLDASHGLGLTFCRIAVEAHGGNIWVEENEPHGSRFCLRLPPAGVCPRDCHDCPSSLSTKHVAEAHLETVI